MSNTTLSDLRLLLNILCQPKLRSQLVNALTGEEPTGVVTRLSFIDQQGIDSEKLNDLRQDFAQRLSPASQLDQDPIKLPPQFASRIELSKKPVR